MIKNLNQHKMNLILESIVKSAYVFIARFADDIIRIFAIIKHIINCDPLYLSVMIAS